MATISKKPVVYKSFRLIDFATYDHREEDADYETPSKFIIQMFGINEKGETCSILVSDYKPFFYTKVSDSWTDQYLTKFLLFLEKSSGKKNIKIYGELVQHRKLYGFDGGRKYKFVKLKFDNIQHMNAIKNLWYFQNKNGGGAERKLKKLQYSSTNNNIPELLELYEGAIPPLLRYFHIENISPSGWVKVPLSCKVDNTNTTTCTYEFICRRSNIKPINDKETCVPYKICSFDIEASSSHGDFPIPKKTYKRLASNIVNLYYNGEHVRLGGVEFMIKKAIITAFGYDTIEDVDIVYPKNQPTQEQINTLIDKLLKTSIDIESSIKEAAATNTIDKMFEKVKQEFSGVDTDDNEADDMADITEMSEKDYISDEECDDNGGKHNVRFAASTSSANKKKSGPNNKKIASILENDEITRDKKIDILNYMLTTLIHFPPLEGDKVTFIGSTFMLYGSSEPYLNHCAVLGSCDPVDGAVIESVNTEYDLLMCWKQLIERENPDIIIGYNIFGFDYEFLFRRAEENHCVSEFLEMTRRVGEKSGKIDYNGKIENIEQTSVVLASGEYDLKYFKMTGRLQIDMYTYMRRDYNLPSYKLDDVASQFIGDDIKRIEYCENDGVTRLYTNNLTGLHVGDYIHIEITSFTTDTYGEKHRIISIERGEKTYITIMGNHSDIDHFATSSTSQNFETKSIRWGLAKDDVSPQDIFRLANEGPVSRAIVAKYCIQDCNLVHHLMNKIDVITGYIEMSRICSVPISFLVLRGQGIKLTSYVAKKCREKNTLMPDLPRESGADDGYEGAIVLPPKCQMYFDNPVACVDYASLYPSSMISENLSHDSKVWTKEYDLTGKLIRSTGVQNSDGEFIYDNLPGYQYVNIEFDTFQYRKPTPTARALKTKVGKMICRWAQFPNGQKAIMPSILEELLRARSDTRKYAKTITDPFMQNILDKRQLGYKVTANSLYGQCGARTSTFYEKDIAASTTATGRKMIIYARNMIEEVYGGGREYNSKDNGIVLTNAEYVYGDTDSVFFTFNLKDQSGADIRGKRALEITIEIAQDVAHLCTSFLKSPMELAYEKTLMPFILLSKKRYVGMLYETNPNKGKLKYMGLSLKRRDSCDYLKDTYGNIIKMLMAGEKITSATNYLTNAMKNLIEEKVPIEKLMLTRSIKSDYKNPAQIAHKVLADRIAKRDPGNKPKSGDRIKFAYIVNSNQRALLGERIETPEFIRENVLKIDYTYYITNQLMKPLQQLFGLAIEQIYIERGKSEPLRTYYREIDKLRREYPDLEVFMKKKEVYCSKEVKRLLFDTILNKIQNARAGNRELTSFWGRVTPQK